MLISVACLSRGLATDDADPESTWRRVQRAVAEKPRTTRGVYVQLGNATCAV